MKTDRELLELAAKAVGLHIEGDADKLIVQPEHYSGGFVVRNNRGGSSLWNPLTDDGDALRLAVACGMNVDIGGGRSAALVRSPASEELHGNDLRAATRRAIVRAAAEIGATK